MILKQITKPGSEPLTLADIERQCRVDDLSSEETEINLMITAARKQAETITRRALITQTWELVLDGFPACAIELPLPPLQSVTSITYLDTNGDEQTLPAAEYQVDADSEPARVAPAYGYSWPATREQYGAVRVRFVCGYGPIDPDTADTVPEEIKQWMALQVAALYENREAVGDSGTVAMPFVDGLLASYRVIRF